MSEKIPASALFMKKLLLILSVLSLLLNSGYAQQLNTNTGYIGKYYWTEVTTVTACHIDGTDLPGTITDNTETTIIDQYFNVIKVVNAGNEEYAIIRILNYNAATQKDKFLKYNFLGNETDYKQFVETHNELNAQERYSKIRIKDLHEAAAKYAYIGGALSGGVINFPFKLRLQNGSDFSTAFNLGAAMGYTFPHYDYRAFTYTALLAASINNVNLDASAVTQNADKLDATNGFSALSFSLGAMVQYDKFQAGIFLGIDKLGKLNNDTFGWKYQGKPWISFGFGYSIFSVQKEKAGERTEQGD